MADYLPPPSDYETRTLGYLKEAIEEGEAFLRAQKGFNLIPDVIKAIMGDKVTSPTPFLSQTTINQVGKIATDITAMCTDIKPFWEYRTKNARYKKHVEMFGSLSEHWWLSRLIDLKFADTIRYSLVAGTGWGHIYFNTNTQDLDYEALDPRDVLPIRPPSTSLSLQESFGVIHRVSRTVNYLKAKFPSKASHIVADRDGSMLSALSSTRMSSLLDKFGSPFRDRLFGTKPAKELPRVPSSDLYTAYLTDDSINESTNPLFMGTWEKGEPLNNWSYKVEKGEPIYPRKRCIIFTNSCILYDGPNIYWHGMFPYPKLTLDPWPWSWLGKGVLWDILPIQRALDGCMRVVDDTLEHMAQPDVLADKNSISKSDLDKINTRRAGLKIRHNPLAGKGVIIDRTAALPQGILEIVRYYEEKLAELPGIRDLSSLARLNQMPSSSTIERMMEGMAPSVRLRSRVIEAFMRDFATIAAWNFAQFYTLPQRLAILGDSGATSDDFDSDPNTFIPAWADSDYSPDGVLKPTSLSRGPLPRYDRSKEFFKQISYHIAPSSLLNASEIETQLKYLQLSRAGLVDHWTLLDVLNIPNVGNPPEGATDITSRLMAEQQMGLGMQVNAAGRKSSGQEMPENRSSGAISESG